MGQLRDTNRGEIWKRAWRTRGRISCNLHRILSLHRAKSRSRDGVAGDHRLPSRPQLHNVIPAGLCGPFKEWFSGCLSCRPTCLGLSLSPHCTSQFEKPVFLSWGLSFSRRLLLLHVENENETPPRRGSGDSVFSSPSHVQSHCWRMHHRSRGAFKSARRTRARWHRVIVPGNIQPHSLFRLQSPWNGVVASVNETIVDIGRANRVSV